MTRPNETITFIYGGQQTRKAQDALFASSAYSSIVDDSKMDDDSTINSSNDSNSNVDQKELSVWLTLWHEAVDRGCFGADMPCMKVDDGEMSTCSSNSVIHVPVIIQKKRKVTFDTVTVRAYNLTVGDHPCCGKGVPLSLDWGYTQQLPALSLDTFESKRASQRKRERIEMLLTAKQRKHMLLELGYTRKEMKQCKREMRRIQRQRRITQILLPMHTFLEEALESNGVTNLSR